MWLTFVKSNNNPVVPAALCLHAVKEHGICHILLKTDCGSENADMAGLQCYLTKNFSSHRYGASHSNQRIENWWSHFRRSFSGWAIDHFKELVHDGKFIPDNMFHMECIWFVYAQFTQTQLDEVKQEWNYHKIRYSKGCQVSGIPNQLYHLPESKGYISQGFRVTESDVTNALAQRNYEDELSEVVRRTNKELKEYFHYIISSQQLNYPPSSWDNAKLLLERIIEQSQQ